MQIGFPFRIDGRGRTAETDEDAHVRELIEQVLFTGLGERVNRPRLGSDLRALTFAPADDALQAATQLTVQAALQQWLSELVQVQAVDVETEDSVVRVTVRYVIQRNQQTRVATFQQGG